MFSVSNHESKTLRLAPKFNGLSCPRCSNRLVDCNKIANGKLMETECLICEYSSTYEIGTYKLAKNF